MHAQKIKHSKQKSNDTVNCGVFVAQYLKLLSIDSFDLSNFSNSKVNIIALRKEMHDVFVLIFVV